MTQVGQLVPSIDIPLLRMLPKEGTTVGLKPLGATTRYMQKKNPDFAALTPSEMSGRLKTLRFLGYVVDIVVLPVGDGAGWQITPAGERLLAKYKEKA